MEILGEKEFKSVFCLSFLFEDRFSLAKLASNYIHFPGLGLEECTSTLGSEGAAVYNSQFIRR